MGESGNLFGKYIFDAAPESESGVRQPIAADESTDGGEPVPFETFMTPAEMRWKVLHSLPKRHQGYVFEAVRQRCAEYLGTQTFRITDRELVSQVWIKILARPDR
jgi:hypothetical protein